MAVSPAVAAATITVVGLCYLMGAIALVPPYRRQGDIQNNVIINEDVIKKVNEIATNDLGLLDVIKNDVIDETSRNSNQDAPIDGTERASLGVGLSAIPQWQPRHVHLAYGSKYLIGRR